jgi:hypothetical protein
VKGFIVVTSIQAPTEAVRRMAAIPGWQMVVVGDRKTPSDWQCDGVVYLSVEDQARMGAATTDCLPFGHYARKNLGYLYAIREGADVIFETDDDNDLLQSTVPMAPQRQRVPVATTDTGFLNIYQLFTKRRVWPRGFPLDLILNGATPRLEEAEVSVPVHQGLANHDPDVDAIYRLVVGELFDFEGKGQYALGRDTWCPFNSQATLWHRDAFWAMLLPGWVPMRVTDIWRGYIAQVQLAARGHHVLFTEPTMRQERNPHDLMHDFHDERMLYADVRRLIAAVRMGDAAADPLQAQVECYARLANEGLVGARDAELAAAWAADLKGLVVP